MMKAKSKKIIAIIAIVIVVVLAIILALLFTHCANQSNATPDQAQATTATIAKGDTTSTQVSTDANGKIIDPTTAKADGDTSVKATEAKTSDTSSKSDSSSSKPNSNSGNASSSKPSSGGNSSSSKPSSGSSSKPSSSSSSSDPHAGQTYHEAVYENVYVVDQEASSYEEPVYETRGYTICHVCGAEFDTTYDSSAFWTHDDQHLLAGEGSGYHSVTREVQTGTRTVNVPEKGHYEKKLVKEAGWY